jgi:prophage antirepressor-like protein|nr:MAG: ORF6C domain protein [Bacteriophage sp.]DAL61715.1 MAG TPA_asm: repressor domain protein [Caudoviricetes sp.]
MNSLQIFNSEEFGEIRTIEIDGKPYFVGTDVAKALGYSNPRKAILDHCKGVTKRDTPTSSGVQSMSYINEGDLYRLIMKSKLPSAEKFESWVMDEVLPAIRKTGSYQKPMTLEEQLQIVAKGTLEVKEEIRKVNEDLQEFKKDMPLLALECQKITKAKNQKVVPLLGGKDSPAYKDNSIRQQVYSDIDAQLRREFGVNTYKAIKRNQCDLAVKIINEYELPMYLKDQIDSSNAQESFL